MLKKGCPHFGQIVRRYARNKREPASTLIIFGNPKAGTPLMNENQSLGLDLPLKVLITEDVDKKVRITYRDPAILQKDYDLKNKKIIGKMQGLYKALAKSVAE